MPIKKYLISAILIFAVIISVWLMMTSNPASSLQEASPNNPDSFMTGIEYVQMNELGQPHSLLSTPKAVHYPKENTTNIDTPYLIVHSKGEPPWHISAEHGKAIQGLEKVLLWDNVRIHQPPGLNSHNITLTTTTMTVYPNRSYAETDQPVTIIQPGSVVHAIGLQVDMKSGLIKLLSKARGQYDSSKK